MRTTLRPDDARLTWQGIVSLERGDGWVMPWRIPHEQRALFPPVELQQRAAMPAGARISFRSDATLLAGELEPVAEMAPLDILCDGSVVETIPMDGKSMFRVDGLPAGEKLIELWLPQIGAFRLRALEVNDEASVAPFEDTRPRWITYGSSITHCGGAQSPAYTWPAIVARERGLNLTCLGFGGQCHLDPMIARMIRDLPADFISMCVGINIQGGATLGPRTFRPAIIGAVQIIREKHPDVPLAVISPIYSPPRETTPNAVGLSLKAMREEVAEAVEALRSCGDPHVHYVHGLDLFGPELAHLLPDELHPNAEGYKALARNFLDTVIPKVFPA